VTPDNARVADAGAYPEGDALRAFYALDDAARGGLDRRAYRDLVANLYLSAADARYEAFRAEVTRDYRAAGTGSDLMALLMNAIASVSRAGAARTLSAGAGAVTGARATLQKDLFYDRSLTAVLDAMDADRASGRAAVREALHNQDAAAYSLGDALDDIHELEGHANLEAGLQQLGALAGAQAQAARSQLHAAFTAPLRDTAVQTELAGFASYVTRLAASGAAPDAQTLHVLAAALGVADDPSTAAVRRNLVLWADQTVRTAGDFAALAAKAKPVTGKDSYP
jgi:hypothetical protein